MATNSHNLLLHRTLQYVAVIAVFAVLGGGYWYWKNVQAGVTQQADQENALTNGLVGYWPFDGDDVASTTAYDRSGQGNNGTLTNGPTKTIGRSGQALNFDGSNDYVALPDIAGLDASGSFTLSAWFKPVAVPGAGSVAYVMSKQGGGFLDWNIQINNNGSNGKLRFNLYNGGNTNVLAATSETVPTVGRWYNVTAVFERTASPSARIYVDGILENTVTTTSFTSYYTPAIIIGADAGGSSPFNGTIDETRGYNRALSASEIWDLYQLGNPDKVNSADSQSDPLERGMVGYWKLDDASGTNATDSSGNGNTGTLTNGPTWTTGQIGGATNFDGSNDYINAGNGSSLGFTGNITFSAWINPTSLADYKFYLGKYSVTDSGYDLGVMANGRLVTTFRNGTHADGFSSVGLMQTGSWQHVVVTQDSSCHVRIYRNGVLDTTLTNQQCFTNPSSNLIIGTRSAGDGNNLSGNLDEVRVYNRALTAEEIAKLYKTTAPDNPDTGLVGYWSFNGPDVSGTTAYDRSGQGNNGTLTNGPTKTIGRSGQALDFDSTDDYVNFGSPATLDNIAQKTVSSWIRMDSYGEGSVGDIFDKYHTTSAGWKLFVDNNGGSLERIGFHQHFGALAGQWYSPNNVISPGQWIHVAVSYDRSSSANDPIFYINGIAVRTSELQGPSGSASDDSANDLYVGNRSGTDRTFDGKIDEPRVYNRILSASEIWDLYQLGLPDKVNAADSQSDPFERGMVGYWKLDDASGTSATDASGNANTGTLTNGPTWTTGRIGGATSFDGSNDYIGITDIDYGSGNVISVSAWIKYSSCTGDSGYCYIVTKDQFVGGNPYLLSSKSDGSITFTVNATNINSSTTYNDNQWHLATGVYDGITAKLLVDGIQVGSSAATAISNNSILSIGSAAAASTYRPFNGQIDEVRVYNRTLSADEVAKLYKTTAPDNPDTGLVGYWSFNGPDIAGTTAYDRSGKGNNGTLTNGPTKTIGKAGQGLSFDGTNDYVSITDSGALNPSSITLSAWVNLATTAEIDSIVSKPSNYLLRTTSGGKFEGAIWGCNVIGTTSFLPNTWYHLLFTYQSGGNGQLHVNGVAEGTTCSGDARSGSAALEIGRRSGFSYFPGKIDEARIYNRALSQTEITALYNAGR